MEKMMTVDSPYVFVVVEKSEFLDCWYSFAKGEELSANYIDFFIHEDSATQTLQQLSKENPSYEFDILKTKTRNFNLYWSRSKFWSYD